MAKGTKKQLLARKQYPRIGMCDVPHCKTLQPQKARFHGMCWYHYCRVGYWAEKTGYDLSWSGNPFADHYHKERLATISAYCEWVKEKAERMVEND